MKLSIIIPVYNVGKYITKCLDSIVCQLTEEVEVVIVDDGSTDNCPEICDNYSKQYNNIRIVHKQNGGLVSARKAGLEVSIGEYVMCVDGDDWLESNAITLLLGELNKKNVDVITFMSQYARGETKAVMLFNYRFGYYTKTDLQKEIYPSLISPLKGNAFPCSIWGKVINRKLYYKYQMQVPDVITLGEDASVSQPCIFGANSMLVLDKVLYNYRYNDNSITKSRVKGFDWELPKIRYSLLSQLLPTDEYDFKAQIDRGLVHSLFNVAKSQFQVLGAKYSVVKKDIVKHISDECYKGAIKRSNAKFLTKEWFAQFALKHKFIFLIYLYAKNEYR